MPIPITHEQYIEKVTKVHNGFYDYGKTVYNGYTNFITIKCPNHFNFKVNAERHLTGTGCPQCKKEKQAKELAERKKAKEKQKFYDYIENNTTFKLDSFTYHESPTEPSVVWCSKCGYQFLSNRFKLTNGHKCNFCKILK